VPSRIPLPGAGEYAAFSLNVTHAGYSKAGLMSLLLESNAQINIHVTVAAPRAMVHARPVYRAG
jgi:hypothetical protein